MVVEEFHVQREVGAMRNFAYLLGDPATKAAAVIDPSFDARELQRIAEAEGYRIEYVFVTHEHHDHWADLPRLLGDTAAKVVAHRLSPLKKDVAVSDGDIVHVGEIALKAVHTPGHTADSTCYVARNKVWTGDTLFIGECGRVDLPGGSAEQLWHSFFEKLVLLPDDLVVFPGHDYGPVPFDSLGNQKRTNYTLRPRSREEFVRFMAEA